MKTKHKVIAIILSVLFICSMVVMNVGAYYITENQTNNSISNTRVTRAPFYFSAYLSIGGVAVYEPPTYRYASGSSGAKVESSNNSGLYSPTFSTGTAKYMPNIEDLGYQIDTIQARMQEVIVVPLSQTDTNLKNAFNMQFDLPTDYTPNDMNFSMTFKYLVYDASGKRRTEDIVSYTKEFRYDGVQGLQATINPLYDLVRDVRTIYETTDTLYIDDVNILISFSSTGYEYRTPILSYAMMPPTTSSGIRPIGLSELENVDNISLIDGSEFDVGTFLFTAVTNFFNFEIFPGLSLLGIVSVIMGISLTIMFLKMFAGG